MMNSQLRIVENRFSRAAEPPINCPASKMTWHMGANGQDQFFLDRHFRYEIFRRHPKRYSIELAQMYIEVYETEGRYIANCTLRYWDKLLNSIDFNLALSESKLIEKAEELAFKCRYFVSNFKYSKSRLSILQLIAKKRGLELPKKDEIGIINRLSNPIWWRRNLRKKHRRGLEKAALELNLVNKRKSPYISNESFQCFLNQLKRNQNLLSSMRIANELNETFQLSDIVEKSISNPRIRRSELMVRISGIESYAKEQKHMGALLTITCPSRMHSALSKSGKRNPKYDHTSPKDAQSYLNNIWARSRAKFKRDNIQVYGVRVVEPHHDGTPHWHLLLFMPIQDYEAVCSILKKYSLLDNPYETGAQERRFTSIKIDWAKGTATGYVAKYISKNIDGFGVGFDDYGIDAANSAKKVTAWASTWGIRQFQFIGGPNVSIWRELRRLSPEMLPNNLIKQCCIAADSGQWHDFMCLLGGHKIQRNGSPIKLFKIWSDSLGKYGEPLGEIVKGLVYESVSYISRVHTWTIEILNKQSQEEKLLNIGYRRMVHEVERPLLGVALEGVPAETIRLRAPMSKTFIPLEFCQ